MLVPSRRRHAEGWRFPTIARPCLHTPSPIPSYPVIFTEPLLDIVLCLDTETMYGVYGFFSFLFSVSLVHHPPFFAFGRTEPLQGRSCRTRGRFLVEIMSGVKQTRISDVFRFSLFSPRLHGLALLWCLLHPPVPRLPPLHFSESTQIPVAPGFHPGIRDGFLSYSGLQKVVGTKTKSKIIS
jgi:hypothetical protein